MSIQPKSAFILGLFIFLGMVITGWLLGKSALTFKEYERVVSVKGLAERELPADVAVWPIRFSAASNDLETIYVTLENNTKAITEFLQSAGFDAAEVSTGAPIVTDKLAERYGEQNVNMRFIAQQVVTVYSSKIDLVQKSETAITQLGRQGIAFSGDEYNRRINYLFTKLNDLKPAMIEESTRNARAAAEQFAADSNSKLGKLKAARQGQFSIEDRDSDTPSLKKLRVVSTVDYYLTD